MNFKPISKPNIRPRKIHAYKVSANDWKIFETCCDLLKLTYRVIISSGGEHEYFISDNTDKLEKMFDIIYS